MVERVLLLPGYSQNAIIFHKKLSAVRKACAKSCEFVFLDPPHILQPADVPSSISVSDPSSVATSIDNTDPEQIPRGWWKSNPERTIYTGVEESLKYVSDFLEKEAKAGRPFAGVFGFSQGAAMATWLCAALENPTLHPAILTSSSTSPHPPFKFAIFVAGFKPVPLAVPPLIQTPSLHVLGQNDFIVVRERSQLLIDSCVESQRRVETHEGGHFVPSKSSWRQFFAAYVGSFVSTPASDFRSVPSPSAILSAAGTPTDSRSVTPPVSIL